VIGRIFLREAHNRKQRIKEEEFKIFYTGGQIHIHHIYIGYSTGADQRE